MARLIAKPAQSGVAPVEVDGAILMAVDPGQVTSVAAFRGRERAVAAALKEIGLGLPAPGRTLAKDGARVLWTGRAQALLIGVEAPAALKGIAALTDQSDALAALVLDGPLAEAALARLVPLDLRRAAFPAGRTARTMLFHMTCSVTRTGAAGFEILVMRSMAASAVHDLAVAMRSVAAQR